LSLIIEGNSKFRDVIFLMMTYHALCHDEEKSIMFIQEKRIIVNKIMFLRNMQFYLSE